METNNKTRLSKTILEMKFMKKTKEKVERQMYQEEGEEYFGSQLTTRMKKKSGQFIIEPSFVFCEQLIDGRLSFQGMNPEIERLMELEEQEKRVKMETNIDPDISDISDVQMAQRWKSFKKIKTEGTKKESYNRKWQRKADNGGPVEKRPKFLKPADE